MLTDYVSVGDKIELSPVGRSSEYFGEGAERKVYYSKVYDPDADGEDQADPAAGGQRV